jgi:hypothetical protein
VIFKIETFESAYRMFVSVVVCADSLTLPQGCVPKIRSRVTVCEKLERPYGSPPFLCRHDQSW